MDFVNQILAEATEKQYEIYCDMDGVLCDFVGGYEKLTGEKLDAYIHISDWSHVDKQKSFWADLEWMEDRQQLWSYIERYKPHILSSPSQSKTAEGQKTQWLKRLNNVDGVYFVQKELKRRYAGPGKILIDDYRQNIDDWIEDGGIGIWHLNTADTIKQLKQLGL